MLRKWLLAGALAFCTSSQAAIVSIDLSGASTGTLITGVGGSFAQTFAGDGVHAAVGRSGDDRMTLATQALDGLGADQPGSADDDDLHDDVPFISHGDAFEWLMGPTDWFVLGCVRRAAALACPNSKMPIGWTDQTASAADPVPGVPGAVWEGMTTGRNACS